MAETNLLIAALTTLLVTVDPLGLVPIFLSLTPGASASDRRHIAFFATLLGFAILSASSLFGAALLDALGITLPAFRVAGGVLLFYMAFEMVFERRQPRKRAVAETAMTKDEIRNIAAFPLAIPLIAGPGAITACILLAARTGGSATGIAWLIGIIALVSCLCLVAFWLAAPIDRLLGNTGRTVLTRLLGVILAALAVQFMADGVRELVVTG